MGLFTQFAAKQEIKVRDNVMRFLAEFSPSLKTGALTLPCHLVPEAHNGFFIDPEDDEDDCVGVFRCEGYWWGYRVTRPLLRDLLSPKLDSALRAMSNEAPNCLCPLNVGIPAFAMQIAMIANP